MEKPKAKRKRKVGSRLTKSKLEMDYLFHSTRQEVFWSELIQTAYSMDMERVKRKTHSSYVV